MLSISIPASIQISLMRPLSRLQLFLQSLHSPLQTLVMGSLASEVSPSLLPDYAWRAGGRRTSTQLILYTSCNHSRVRRCCSWSFMPKLSAPLASNATVALECETIDSCGHIIVYSWDTIILWLHCLPVGIGYNSKCLLTPIKSCMTQGYLQDSLSSVVSAHPMTFNT